MCFLNLIVNPLQDYPLIVAANRDEYLDRQGSEPFEIQPGILAGRDERSGGTWLGINRGGLVVAVTNRHDPAAPERPAARSRGLLCLDMLKFQTSNNAQQAMEHHLSRHNYNGFNLVLADRKHAFAVSHWRCKTTCLPLGAGIHVIANTTPNDLDDPRVARGLALLRQAGIAGKDASGALADFGNFHGTMAQLQAELEKVCRDHGTGRDDSICLHAAGRGTLSSAVISLHRDQPGRNILFWAQGQPCQNPYRDRSSLLQGLR